MRLLVILLLALFVIANVAVVDIGGKKYIVVNFTNVNAKLNFTFVAVRNETGVYVVASPSAQRIACLHNGKWHNGTGAVALPKDAQGVICFFAGLDYGVLITPIRAVAAPAALAGYAWVLSLAAVGAALYWRRLEVAGIFAIAMGLAMPYVYHLFAMPWGAAVAMAIVLIAMGAFLIAMSFRGE